MKRLLVVLVLSLVFVPSASAEVLPPDAADQAKKAGQYVIDKYDVGVLYPNRCPARGGHWDCALFVSSGRNLCRVRVKVSIDDYAVNRRDPRRCV